MTVLERIQIARAEEQIASVRMDEPTTHDPWAIRPSEVQGRANGKGKHRPRPCLAGDCARRVSHHGYCKMHWERVYRGSPVDLEAYVSERDTRRWAKDLPSQRRFGSVLSLASRNRAQKRGA